MTSAEDPRALALLRFWWGAGPDNWFARDDAFDAECRVHAALTEAAAGGGRGLDGWRATAAGTLALILLTDQIPRNAFRGTAEAFATDAFALATAEQALAAGFPDAYPMPARNFFLLPFMHAEDLAAQERGLDLYRAQGDKDMYYYALVHHDAIRRFGRFPHRNVILGRTTTPEEQAYLDSGGFVG
jgi:uncharacterized protein (DUF924 family)